METIEVRELFSNIITPPDFVNSRDHAVVLIDPTASEVEDLAIFLKTAVLPFNVYVYREEMNDLEWLKKAISKSLAVVINTLNNNISTLKDKLVCDKRITVHYYGSKNFLMNPNKIEKPLDYFVQYINH